MKEIVIIGAGPAGLTAGLELYRQSKEDIHVTILEADKRLGGISKTVVHNGNRMDIGGHRFFSKDESVMKWWMDILPLQGAPSYDDRKLGRKIKTSDGPDPEVSDEVMLLRRRVSRIYYDDKFFDYPIKMNFATFRKMGFFTTSKAALSYMRYAICKRKENSLEDFYINRFGKVLYKMFFESYTQKVWGIHPSKISPDWGAQRVKGISLKAVFKDMFNSFTGKKNASNTETSLIEEFYYPKFGPGQLWETVAKRFEDMGGTICTSSRVVSLHTEGDRVVSLDYKDEHGEVHNMIMDELISSMPVKELIDSMPNVPADVKSVADGLMYRDFVTIGILAKKLKLKNETSMKTLSNIVPDCWIYVQDKRVRVGRIQIFNNWSPYMVNDPDNTVYIGMEFFCHEKEHFVRVKEEPCAKAAIRELVKMGILDEDDVIEYHKEAVYKAYPAYFGTYDRIGEVVDYLNGYSNLYCVGRNGQHRYNNMDHSMLTAFAAVDCIVHDKKDKSAIWSVNTEKTYHESRN